MSKVIEQCSTAQLNEYLLTNDLMPRLQSAYRKQHSTETALLRVWSDTLNAADTQVTRLATCTCLQHSTALITISCCSGWNMALVCRTLCCYGSIRSCPTEHSKWLMEANFDISTAVVRRTAGLCFRAFAVHSVHRRTRTGVHMA